MQEWPILASCLAFGALITVLLPLTANSQPSSPQLGRRLNTAEEEDSYQIYSLLLKAEMPPQWKVSTWNLQRDTQTFPSTGNDLEDCVRIPQAQESVYRPTFQDYVEKNKKKFILERKFDLPSYTLVGPTDGKPSLIFHVSAVGFGPDGTRALVYVGHRCGSLCGGGRYHVLVKKDGKWQEDREFGGSSCIWTS
jgi:hypothetical protein